MRVLKKGEVEFIEVDRLKLVSGGLLGFPQSSEEGGSL
jgi:hypothetical protein